MDVCLTLAVSVKLRAREEILAEYLLWCGCRAGPEWYPLSPYFSVHVMLPQLQLLPLPFNIL